MPPDRQSNPPSLPPPSSSTLTASTSTSAVKPSEKRSRLACVACRAVKQRCDGPSRVPCRRCEQFSIECVFKDGPRLQAARAAMGQNGHQPLASTSTLPRPFPSPTFPSPSLPYPSPSLPQNDVSSALREIAGRLGRLEEALLPDGSASGSPEHSDLTAHNFTHPGLDESPLSQVQSSVVRLNTLGEVAAAASSVFTPPSEGDAISRGVVQPDLANDLFTYFFDHLHERFPVADVDIDRDPNTVRQRNSLLFHSILLASAYYVLLRQPQGRPIYRALANLVADSLGRQLLFARALPNGQLSRDVVVAILLCIVRKPIFTEASDDAAEVTMSRQFQSRINYDMGFLLTGLAARAQLLLGLNQICDRLLQAVDADGYLQPSKVPTDDVVKQCRLWLVLCLIDAHGSVSACRAPSLVTANSTRASSIFASLARSSQDIWIAALIHLALLAREHFGRAGAGSDRQHDVECLSSLHRSLGVWSTNWATRIGDARHIPGRQEISVRYETVVAFMHARFLQLSATTTFIRRWATAGQPVHGEVETVHEAIEAAKALLSALAVEDGGGGLRPSDELARLYANGPDNALTVVLPFSALFLAKHAPMQPTTQTLLALAADFLDTAAPHPTHPCVGHARILRQTLRPPHVPANSTPAPFTAMPAPIDLTSGTFDTEAILSMIFPQHGTTVEASTSMHGGQLLPLDIDWAAYGLSPSGTSHF